MQRSKASSVGVKKVIGTLCKLLAAAGLDCVPVPETFRRAKFDGGTDVENHFLQLLAHILKKTTTVSFESSTHMRGVPENFKLVAAGLLQTGYYADWIYEVNRGGDGEKSFSSRDLLLALGWLIAAGALEKLLSQRVQQLDKTLLTSPPTVLESPQLSQELQFDSDSLRRFQWLYGRLRHQGRILLSMQEQRARLLHTVLSVSSPSSVTCSSCDQSSTVLRKDCECMREVCDLLEAYVNWKQVENIFWTWMDSVVDGHLAALVVKKPTQGPEGRSEICHHGNRGLEKLDDMPLRRPTTQKGQSGGGLEVEDRGKVSEKGHGGPDTSLPTFLSSFPPLPSFFHIYRARLQGERPVSSSGAEAPAELLAAQAVQLLLQTEARLLETRDRQRQTNKTQLEEMIGSMDQLVLIPP